MFALNVSNDGRVLSTTYDEYATADQPRVDELPEGDLYEYRYVNGIFIHDPLPAPDPAAPTPSDSERISVLEQQMKALMGGVSDVQQ